MQLEVALYKQLKFDLKNTKIHLNRPSDEISKHARLKIVCRKACGCKSHLGHQYRTEWLLPKSYAQRIAPPPPSGLGFAKLFFWGFGFGKTETESSRPQKGVWGMNAGWFRNCPKFFCWRHCKIHINKIL